MIRKTIELDAPPARAFEVFAGGISGWWPAGTHSIGEERVAEVVLEPRAGGLLYELLDDGTRHEWADVVAYDPPRRIALAWRVNPKRELTHVEITFTEVGDGRTRLVLEHGGWRDEAGRVSYDTGWEVVLARYLDSVRAFAGANSSQSLLK